jgi:Short C-terminal domain
LSICCTLVPIRRASAKQADAGGDRERRVSVSQRAAFASSEQRTQMPAFVTLRDDIEQAMIARFTPQSPVPAPANVLEQIQQLASLRDQGILNDAEFEAKKAELLSRM